MTEFQEGDVLEVVTQCCALEVGARGVFRNGMFVYSDGNNIHNASRRFASYFKKVEPTPDLLILDDPIKTETVGLMQSQAEAHAAELLNLQRRLNDSILATEKARQDHASDINKISEFFAEKANDNDLCEQYDDAVVEVNDTLVLKLTPRSQEFVVTFTFRQDITVRATDDSAAVDLAREEYEYGRLSQYEEDDYDVEEVEG